MQQIQDRFENTHRIDDNKFKGTKKKWTFIDMSPQNYPQDTTHIPTPAGRRRRPSAGVMDREFLITLLFPVVGVHSSNKASFVKMGFGKEIQNSSLLLSFDSSSLQSINDTYTPPFLNVFSQRKNIDHVRKIKKKKVVQLLCAFSLLNTSCLPVRKEGQGNKL